MKVPQAVRLMPPDGDGEIIVKLPMDVELFAKFTGPLGRAGWMLVARRDDVPPELADVPDVFFEVAKLAWDGVHHDGTPHKQWYLAEILEACGVQLPDGLDRGRPA